MNEKLEDLFEKIKFQKTSFKEQFYTAFFVIGILVSVLSIMLLINN